MHTSPRSALRFLTAAFALLFVLAACASSTGATWTYAPVAATVDEGPTGSAAPGQSPAAEQPSGGHEGMAADGSAPPPSGEGRVIDIVATASLQFTTPDGTQLTDIPVTPGETVIFRVENAAGFDHNFYIGTDAELSVPSATTPTGIPTWQSGVQELTWVVPEDISGLKFGCTVPGHYALMQGTFSVAS